VGSDLGGPDCPVDTVALTILSNEGKSYRDGVEVLKPVMIPWIDPSDPRNRLAGGGVLQHPPEFIEAFNKFIAQWERYPRKRGPKKSLAIFPTVDELKEGMMKALIRMKDSPDPDWSVTNLARTYGVARSTLYDSARRLQVNVPAFIQDFLRLDKY
jgi:hypothetical protein